MRLGPKVLAFALPLSKGAINTITVHNDSCSSTSVWDYAGLVCSDCFGGSTGIQVSSAGYNANPLLCTCPSTSLRSDVECSVESMLQGTCQGSVCSSECVSSSRVASFDQSQCVPCSIEGDTKQHYGFPSFDANSNECKCENPPKSLPSGERVITYRLVEIYDTDSGLPIHYDCLRCPKGTAVITEDLYDNGSFFSTAGALFIADDTTCASCPDPHMYFDTDYSCKCADGFLMTGEAAVGPQSCIESYPSVASGYSKAVFNQGAKNGASADGDGRIFTLDSITFSHYYLRAASQCEFFQWVPGDRLQSCQVLGNLCVLNMYDEDSAACKQFLALSQSRSITYHSQEEWKHTLPWLYYADEAHDVINDRGLKMKMAFSVEDNSSTDVSFKLAKYKLDGSFVGMEDVTNQFEFCSDSNSGGDVKWKTFGEGYRLEYTCDIERLLAKEMFFYDMYVVDNGPEACKPDPINSVCLYPVPVLNRNFAEKGGLPNMNQYLSDEVNDRYTRRFFLFDNKWALVLPIPRPFYGNVIHLKMAPMCSLLLIQIQSENPTRLNPPRLIIEYETETIPSLSGSRSLLFKVDYSMKTDTFWNSIQILIGFVAAFAVVVYGVKMNNWLSRQHQALGRRNDGSLTSMTFVVHAIMILCHTLVLLFLPFTAAICSYWLQDSVFLLLPSDNEFYRDVGNEYYFLMLSFQGLFVCQTVYLAYTIAGQCRSNIFFVDWERPKGRTNNGVSTWRTVLVANEWLSMQTARKHSITFSLVLVGFFTTVDSTQSGHPNIALRFASSSFFWCLSSFIQWLWRFFVFERWYNEPRSQRLVDLCTICNISMFVLPEPHRGYYIHGRSPYQYSDCSIDELLDSFRKEAQGFTVSRGLDAASRADQVFVMFCSSAFHSQISKIFKLIKIRQTEEAQAYNRLGKAELSTFLKGFIYQQPPPVQEGLKYVVRDAILTETVLGLTPADFRMDDPKCLLEPDCTKWNRDYTFLSATFLGIEMDLLVHDILTYNVVDLMFDNPATSIFATYLMHIARTWLAAHFAKNNLSHTSFIDKRFLL
eukprot:CCRYP_006304-RC/>CCRYP_006304-RC protein AED:0.04 eAED:0.04 QI:1898/0.4/0.66/1/0.6/0.66/6/31/1047